MVLRGRSPIALFAFRRPVHLAKTLAALVRNPQTVDAEVYAFVDAPRETSDAPLVEEVCRTLEDFAAGGQVKHLEIHRAQEHKGLAQSVIEGLSLVLHEHDRVIGLEDDIVLSVSGLGFLNAALDAYQHDRGVWSVSAFSPPLRIPTGYDETIYFSRRASSWGYATWKDRWEEVSWDNDYFQRLASSARFRRRFALGGHDLPRMLDMQLAGDIDSWAIRWCARQAELGSLTVYPIESLALNSGLDGSGTHSPAAVGAAGSLGTWRLVDGQFGEPRLDPQISRRFRKYYVSRTRILASKAWACVVPLFRGKRAIAD